MERQNEAGQDVRLSQPATLCCAVLRPSHHSTIPSLWLPLWPVHQRTSRCTHIEERLASLCRVHEQLEERKALIAHKQAEVRALPRNRARVGRDPATVLDSRRRPFIGFGEHMLLSRSLPPYYCSIQSHPHYPSPFPHSPRLSPALPLTRGCARAARRRRADAPRARGGML